VSDIGSRNDLEAFLDTRRDSLVRFGYVLTGSTAAAEDLTQDALLAVFKRWRTVNPAGAEAYTRRTMARLAWRLAKNRRAHSVPEPVESKSAPVPDHDAEIDIRAAVQLLSIDKRTVIVLRYWLGYSDTQIADELGCSVGTVKSRGHRAMTELRALLGPELAATAARRSVEQEQSHRPESSTREHQMTSPLGPELKQHFDELAQEAPPAHDALVATARHRGDHRRHQTAMGVGTAAVALALAVGLGLTQPWSGSADTPVASPSKGASPTASINPGTSDQHVAGTSWKLLRQPGGRLGVEHYDTIEALFAAAPLLARGAVTGVEVGKLIDNPQVDQPYRDLLLTITPAKTAGPAAVADRPVIVQLGPFFGTEAEQWATEMSTGPTSLIGDEAVWALRPREDAPTYRPLTSEGVFVRDGDSVFIPLKAETSISEETRSRSWSQLVAVAGLSG
jgi:RNA polymerase sigma-70 factor (sigma-E family)